MTEEQPSGNAYQRLATQIKQYVNLSIENARLGVAEKMSVLLSTIAIALIAFALITIAVLFFTIAMAHLLAEIMPLIWAYGAMCCLNLLVLILILLFRKPLIINPIARLVSKLLLQ
ncbi:MAG: phage holin family protein [Paramuribaculum sp.]|nr:hypothetical protein [Bacteroides sp.]MDE6826743.1 phage holin family protein [Paramuribaculum sp.]MDE7470708.1 phage holin family protein [Paramuribaculum sp.]